MNELERKHLHQAHIEFGNETKNLFNTASGIAAAIRINGGSMTSGERAKAYRNLNKALSEIQKIGAKYFGETAVAAYERQLLGVKR